MVRHPIIVLLSADCEVSRGWLDPILAAHAEHPEFGWITPTQINPDGKRQPFAGPCSVFTREAIEAVGPAPWDEFFSPCTFDDDDLLWRLVRAGYRPHGIADCTVKHLAPRSTTDAIRSKETLAATWARNLAEIQARYGSRGTNYDAIPVYSAKDRTCTCADHSQAGYEARIRIHIAEAS
jgi:GT2 family glycosyltransferase